MNPCDKRGFTLIEVMVTLVILAFGMLASAIGIMSALDHNLINEMRNEAMKIAQEQEETVRNTPYASINQNIPATQQIYRQVRKQLVCYDVTFTQPYTSGSTEANGIGMTLVQFKITWNFKRLPQFKYILQTVVRLT
jgi:prepilin-type N-terminal cleavage/methylation domain-containing protein